MTNAATNACANIGMRKRIRAFFATNPSEELTKAEMMVKFDAKEHQVDQALWALKAEGALVRAIVYRAAPKGVE